jgi:PLP dependent protein
MTIRTTGPAALRDGYHRIMDRIAEAALRRGRRPQDVVMVAVTKTATPDQIRTLVEMGHADLGESRVQQLTQRAVQLEEFLSRKRTLGAGSTRAGADQAGDKARWHMIGHLQRNKIKMVVPLVNLIHSVDTLRLAEDLHGFGARTDRVIDILIQVNTANEPSKFGVAPPAVIHLAEQIDTMVNLRVRGLMTMAPYSDNAEDSRSVFARTAEIFQEIREAKIGGASFNVLSMGMTNDFEIAIAEGANVVRIGRALFGDEEQI